MFSSKSIFEGLKTVSIAAMLFSAVNGLAQECYDSAKPMCGPYGNPLTFAEFQAGCVDESNQFREKTCGQAQYKKRPDGMWYCVMPYHMKVNMGTYWKEYDAEGGTMATCPPGGGFVLNQINGQCQKALGCPVPIDLPKEDSPPEQCPKPDGLATPRPILPANGEKFRHEYDLSLPGAHPVSFERLYRSGRVGGSSLGPFNAIAVNSAEGGGGSDSASSVYPDANISALGKGWSTNLLSQLHINQDVVEDFTNFPLGWATLDLGNGTYRKFSPNSPNWTPVSESPGKFW